MKYTWPANTQAQIASLLRGWQADTTLATAGPTHPQTSVQQMCFDLHVFPDWAFWHLGAMAKLDPGRTLIWHPSSQAKACAAVSCAPALQILAERYLMPAELVCCMWHLYSCSPVHFLTSLTLLCQHHLHSFQPLCWSLHLVCRIPCFTHASALPLPLPACLAHFNFTKCALYHGMLQYMSSLGC